MRRRWPTSSASPRCSARRSRAPSPRSAWSAPTSSATTCAPSTPRRDRRSRRAGGRLRRAARPRAPPCSTAPASRAERRRFERSVDARYERQSYELSMPVPPRTLDAAALAEIAEAFHDRHRADLRPRQPRRAGAARQRARHRHRRHPAAADPRQDRPPPAPTPIKAQRRVWFRDDRRGQRRDLRPRTACRPASWRRARPSSSRWSPPFLFRRAGRRA